jgi:hypothetical protein
LPLKELIINEKENMITTNKFSLTLSKLRSLDGIEKYQNIEYITLNSLNELESVEPILKLKNLKSINNKEYSQTTVILDGLYIRSLEGILTNTRLTELSVASCENLLNIEQIWQLATLKRLNLQSTKIESLDGIQKLHNLQNLDISYCYKLKTIKPVFALKRL